MIKPLNRLACEKYNEKERFRAHLGGVGNQHYHYSKDGTPSIILEDVLKEMRGLREQERNVRYTRGKKALEGRFTQEEHTFIDETKPLTHPSLITTT
jgi:hypothetical protein